MPAVLGLRPQILGYWFVQCELVHTVYCYLLLELYSDQHWRSIATCAAALGFDLNWKPKYNVLLIQPPFLADRKLTCYSNTWTRGQQFNHHIHITHIPQISPLQFKGWSGIIYYQTTVVLKVVSLLHWLQHGVGHGWFVTYLLSWRFMLVPLY